MNLRSLSAAEGKFEINSFVMTTRFALAWNSNFILFPSATLSRTRINCNTARLSVAEAKIKMNLRSLSAAEGKIEINSFVLRSAELVSIVILLG